MKILIVPRTLRGGAKRCLTVAREANSSAQRLAGLPMPEGTPPEVVGQLNAAAAQLSRSSAAAERQAQFLVARAQRGLLADGPFGSPLDLLGPGLLSPWAPPAAPKKDKKRHWWDGPVDFLGGAGAEVLDTIKGLSDTGLGIAGHMLDGDPLGLPIQRPGPRLSDHIPIIGKRRRELDEAVDWARRHPDEFALAVGKDLVAYDDHAKGNHSRGAGRNTVGILGLLVPFSKAGTAGKASKAAKSARAGAREASERSAAARVTQQRAHIEHTRSVARRPGESAAAHAARRRTAQAELVRARGQARLAEHRVETEVQRARDAAEAAAAAKSDALKEGGQAAGESGAKVLGSHDEAKP